MKKVALQSIVAQAELGPNIPQLTLAKIAQLKRHNTVTKDLPKC